MNKENFKNIFIKNILVSFQISILIVLLYLTIGTFFFIPMMLLGSNEVYGYFWAFIIVFLSAFGAGLIFKTNSKTTKSLSLINKLITATYFYIYYLCYAYSNFKSIHELLAHFYSFLLYFILIISSVYIALTIVNKINIEDKKSIYNVINSKIPLCIKLSVMTINFSLFFFLIYGIVLAYLNSKGLLIKYLSLQSHILITIYFTFILPILTTIGFYTYKYKKALSIANKIKYSLCIGIIIFITLFLFYTRGILYTLLGFIITYFIIDFINRITLLRVNSFKNKENSQ